MPRFIQYLLSRNLEGKELTDEKIRDFKRIVMAQAGIISTLFLLALFKSMPFPYHIEIAESLFLGCIGIYAFFLWDTLRNYTTNRRVILINFIIINGVFLFGLVSTNPFILMDPTLPYRVEIFVIYFTILEFFKKELGLGIKLWGAAALYLMIGLSFACVYEILCVIQPDCLGVDLPLRSIAFMNRMNFSLMVLSGMEIPYAPNDVLYSVAMIESLWGQIFIVLIVGRLLVK